MDQRLSDELSGVRIDKRELGTLRNVHNGIVGPLREELNTVSDERGFQSAAFVRIEFFVATLVECAREGLLQAQAQGESLDFTGLVDLQKLLVYLPEEEQLRDVMQQVSMFQPDSTMDPIDAKNKLGLSMRADETTIDGKLRHTFSQQQSVEYGCIYTENNRLTPFPTAPKLPQAELVH